MAVCPSSTQPFYIQNAASPYCVLDVEGSSPDPGARVLLWSLNDPPSPNQLWTYENGYIINQSSKLCLQIQLDANDNIVAGAPLSQGPKLKPGDNYRQLFVINTDWGYIMPWDPRAPRLAVAGENNGTSVGTEAVVADLYDFPRTVPQQWTIHSAPQQ